MSDLSDLELWTIAPEAVPRAIAKAEHYRLLHQPAEAESICRDILAVAPDNEQAQVVLVLALTDQFTGGSATGSLKEATERAANLTDEYKRRYYSGIVRERRARALLALGTSHGFAYTAFREAMDFYEAARGLMTDDDNEAILRWNSCLRSIRAHHLEPPVVEAEQPLE
jgi:hypothetical protein